MSTTTGSSIASLAVALGAKVHTPPATPPVVEDNDLLMQAWCTDIARAVHEPRTIAARYGFEDVAAMQHYVATHPAIERRIKELTAAWESDSNVETRVRCLAGHAVLEALPTTGRLMLDPLIAANTKVDALKAHARIAGVDIPPAVARDAQAGASPGQGKFSVQIIFASTGKVENITTVEGPETSHDGLPSIEGEVA
jgi:hypothetical protein